MGKYIILRPHNEAEYHALKNSIRERGVLVSVKLDEEGNILDGHHRVRAYEELWAEGHRLPDYPRTIHSGLSESEKIQLIHDLNEARRHLSPADLHQMHSHKGKREAITASLKQAPDRADNWHAQQLGVDDHTVHVVREELEEGSEIPNLKTVIGADGKRYPKKRASLRKASVFLKNRREVAEARELLKRLPEPLPPGHHDVRQLRALERKARARELAQQESIIVPAGVDIRHCDFRVLDVQDGTVDLLFTDPPYGKEYLPLWSALGAFAARVLKSGKLLVVYSSIYLPEVLSRLGEHLTYVAAGAVVARPGQDARLPNLHIWQRSKTLLFFVNGDYVPGPWFCNTVASEAPEKDLHPWQQSIKPARYYVRRLTKPSDLVCDPFLGSGTTAVAAHELGRRFIGCDIDLEVVKIAQGRVGQQGHPQTVASPATGGGRLFVLPGGGGSGIRAPVQRKARTRKHERD